MSPGRGGMRGEVPGCSDWMSKLPSELHDKPLWDLVIPGEMLKGYQCLHWHLKGIVVQNLHFTLKNSFVPMNSPLCLYVQNMISRLFKTLCVCVSFFPGSHDSMSYDLDINSAIIEPDMLKKYSRLRCVREKVMKWAMAQVCVVYNPPVFHRTFACKQQSRACLCDAGGDHRETAGCRCSLL